MGAKKVQNDDEAMKWLRSGVPYDEIIDRYKKQYNLETTRSMWSTYRRRKKIPARNVRNTDLIPWKVREEHRYEYPVMMLRAEGRRLAGKELTKDDEKRLASWRAELARKDLVVHYDPDTESGWFYVPRSEGDDELIHPPE
ncbi:hypothetical protein ACIBCB_18430 [Streptomyces uncialis]|uniref:hypothetical protein n=1 Tax=Streptomyces uncialis TaxID=1048205 RepID=UPI0037B65D47